MAYVFLFAVTTLLLAGWITVRALQQRVRRLEERLDGLAAQTGQDEYKSDYVSEKLQNELKQMKKNGQTVQAVKRLRASTGIDLVRAKQYIDRLS